MFSTVYFRFRNYQNTGVVFVSENTVPLSFPMKNYESESGAVFRRPFLTVFIPNPFRLKGHRGKENYARGYIGATELFRGMGVITNFHKDIHVKDSSGYSCVASFFLLCIRDAIYMVAFT